MEDIIKALVELDIKRDKLCKERNANCYGCPLRHNLMYGEESSYDICDFLDNVGDIDVP